MVTRAIPSRVHFAFATMVAMLVLLSGRRAEGQIIVPPESAEKPRVYQRLRYDEDYTYLRDPAKRSDVWDPIKYIPLNDTGDSYLSLGGEARERYELYNNDR